MHVISMYAFNTGCNQILLCMDYSIDEIMRDYTSIRVEKEVRDALDALGIRRESYNEIIKRLIDFYNSHRESD